VIGNCKNALKGEVGRVPGAKKVSAKGTGNNPSPGVHQQNKKKVSKSLKSY